MGVDGEVEMPDHACIVVIVYGRVDRVPCGRRLQVSTPLGKSFDRVSVGYSFSRRVCRRAMHNDARCTALRGDGWMEDGECNGRQVVWSAAHLSVSNSEWSLDPLSVSADPERQKEKKGQGGGKSATSSRRGGAKKCHIFRHSPAPFEPVGLFEKQQECLGCTTAYRLSLRVISTDSTQHRKRACFDRRHRSSAAQAMHRGKAARSASVMPNPRDD